MKLCPPGLVLTTCLDLHVLRRCSASVLAPIPNTWHQSSLPSIAMSWAARSASSSVGRSGAPCICWPARAACSRMDDGSPFRRSSCQGYPCGASFSPVYTTSSPEVLSSPELSVKRVRRAYSSAVVGTPGGDCLNFWGPSEVPEEAGSNLTLPVLGLTACCLLPGLYGLLRRFHTYEQFSTGPVRLSLWLFTRSWAFVSRQAFPQSLAKCSLFPSPFGPFS